MASLILLCLFGVGLGCTNFIISKGASENGETMISYAADSHTLYGALYYRPAANYSNNTYLEIYDWDSGRYLGKIKQVPHTYLVVGNMNEFQVTIGETTYGGLSALSHQDAAKLDYGNLMWVTLQRAKTAREAIHVMGQLVSEYGYASEGESFSIGDKNEVWIMEMIGKGNYELGAVWVARRIPDGYVCGHANQARIRTFTQEKHPQADTDTIYSPDVVSFAKKHGFYSGPDVDFSFSDVYDPVNFFGARYGESRVWSMFNHIKDMSAYLSYVQGRDLKNRMPLWILPDRKISLQDMRNFMRNHFEGTWFDMTKDFGAEPFQLPYRWRPLAWTVKPHQYVNERAVSTQQTGFVFIAQMRSWYPDPIGGIFWFAVDDTYTNVWFPAYCGITAIPEEWGTSKGSILEFNYDSAFWIFNMVSNFAYLRYNQVIGDIQAKQSALEKQYDQETADLDTQAAALYKTDPAAAIRLMTSYSVTTGSELVKEWQSLWATIFPKYLDGDVKVPKEGQKFPVVTYPGYSQEWYDEIVAKTGDHFLVYGSSDDVPRTQPKLGRVKGL